MRTLLRGSLPVQGMRASHQKGGQNERLNKGLNHFCFINNRYRSCTLAYLSDPIKWVEGGHNVGAINLCKFCLWDDFYFGHSINREILS